MKKKLNGLKDKALQQDLIEADSSIELDLLTMQTEEEDKEEGEEEDLSEIKNN